MTKPTIVGIAGAQGAGKDTIAAVLVQLFGYHRIAFGDPLREAASAIFGLTQEEMLDRDLKEKPLGRGPWKHLTPRRILQLLGTESCRDVFHPQVSDDYDIETQGGIWSARVWDIAANYSKVVIPDVRFADEAASIKNRGGIMIHVERPGLSGGATNHASEKEWQALDFDARIVNDASNALAFRAQVAQWWTNF